MMASIFLLLGEMAMDDIACELFGRHNIYATDDNIDDNNIIDQVNEALSVHVKNLLEEETLYWYRRGITPILSRTKEIRPEINNKISESSGLAGAIVDFWDGYFLTQPAFYVSRRKGSQGKTNKLNEYLYRSGKHDADNTTVDWFYTVGKGALMIKSNDDKEVPAVVYALDPRSAFVVYSMAPGNEPVMGVNTVVVGDKLKIDAITKDKVYRLSGGVTGRFITNDPVYTATAVSVDAIEDNPLGEIPIIEYSANTVNMAAFERAISLLDALDKIQSNRLDAIEQFVQSLIVTWNCKFEDGVTANQIRQYGMVNLQSTGDNKQDLKVLSEQLDQGQTQTLIDDIYEKILSICNVPLTSKSGNSTSDTGIAVLARAGWLSADNCARNTEDLFKKANRRFDKIFTDILRRKKLLDISPADFDLMFVRNETSNIQSKAQAFQTLMSGGLEPSLALAKSGVSNDPVSDYKLSEKWMKLRWGDPEATEEAEAAEAGAATGVPEEGGESGRASAGEKASTSPSEPSGQNASQKREGWVNGYYRD